MSENITRDPNEPIVVCRKVRDMGDEYVLNQKEDHVNAVYDSVNIRKDDWNRQFQYLFVLVGDAEILEVWGAYSLGLDNTTFRIYRKGGL